MGNAGKTATAAALVTLLACGSDRSVPGEGALAEKLLNDAREAKHEERFDAARRYLERALENAPQGSSLHEEIQVESGFRLPLLEAYSFLEANDAQGVAKNLEQLERFVREHPGRLQEARELDDLRLSALVLGRSEQNTLAAQLLNDARKAKHEEQFDAARRYLERALENTPAGSPLREEILFEKSYRLPVVEAYYHLQSYDAEGLVEILEQLDEFVRDHPGRLREAREVDDLRRSAFALEQSLSMQTKSYLKHLEMELETYLQDRGEYPDRDGLAELMESWPNGPYFSVESYERIESGNGYKAVLVDPNTGALVTLEKDGWR